MAHTYTQLAVIAMVRNEADILPAFLSHLRVLFDRIFVIDHMSTDGSREILEAARADGYRRPKVADGFSRTRRRRENQ